MIGRLFARSFVARQKPVMRRLYVEVTAGPERAALLGVPVGTVVETRDIREYRNPLRQLWWRLSHRHDGRFTIERSVV